MAKVKTYVTINSINVTSKVVTWQTKDTFGNEIPDMVINLSKAVNSLLTIENGQEVVVKRGLTTGQEQNIFKGRVDTIGKENALIIVKCKDELIQLVKADVNTSFDKNVDSEVGVGSAIANTLITDSRYGNMSTNSGATVQSSGAVILLEKFVCRKTDVFERVKTIAAIYDFQIYYNYDDDYVYFEPTGYQSNFNSLIVGTNVSNLPKWEFDNTQLINQIRVEGAESLVQTVEIQTIAAGTNYNQTDFLLKNSPQSVKVFYENAADPAETVANLKIGGTVSATATFDYSIDEQNNKIVWNTSQFTPTIGFEVKVKYGYPSPIPVIRKRQTSIDSYGFSATTKHFPDIRTVEDAMNRGDLWLNTYSVPFVRTFLHVPSILNDYRPGQSVTVVDSINDENRQLNINKIVKSFPHKYDVISVGNQEYAISEYNRLTLDKIKRLEEELSKNDDILIQVLDLNRTFKPRRRYFKLNKDVITLADSFILGHPSGGVFGTNKLGVTYASSNVVKKLIQGNMTYEEYAYDTDFHDAVNSTATFSTVTHDISFTSGQVWYSSVIDLGTTIKNITVDLGTVVGTLLIEISSDNKSTWQTITEGTKTVVTSSDGLGTYIRITESAAGVATIDLTQNVNGENTKPVIKMVLEE